jgi:hypothetical protein
MPPSPAPGARAGPLSASPTRLQIHPTTARRQVLSDSGHLRSLRAAQGGPLAVDGRLAARSARPPTRSLLACPPDGHPYRSIAAAQKRDFQAPCALTASLQEEADKRAVASQLEDQGADLSEAWARRPAENKTQQAKAKAYDPLCTMYLCSL